MIHISLFIENIIVFILKHELDVMLEVKDKNLSAVKYVHSTMEHTLYQNLFIQTVFKI